jgi:dolichyl-phosphate-mannose-protein mannosyltransferase
MNSSSSLQDQPKAAASPIASSVAAWRISHALAGVLLVLVIGGVVLRVRALGFPSNFTFDEEHFAKNAHNYLRGVRDFNDHPPLGKLLIAVGLLLFGYDSLGWRFVPLCFGLQTLFVVYRLALELFEDRSAARYAAAFVAADGFFIAYSRAGLLDGILTCLVLWSVLAAVVARNTRGVLAAALLVGLATSVKWSGITALVPALVALLCRRQVPKRSVLVFAVVPVVHLAIWSAGLRLTGQPSSLPALWRVMVDLFHHHLELGHRQNALASPWYTWAWLRHPIVVKQSIHGATSRYAAGVGNPVLWLAASFFTIAALGTAFVGAFSALRRRAMQRLFSNISYPELVLSVGWFALLSPWIVARGNYTFMYHYLPSYGFALTLLAGRAAKLERQSPRVALYALLLVALVSAYFVPVWGEFAIDEASANRRLVFHSWRP